MPAIHPCVRRIASTLESIDCKIKKPTFLEWAFYLFLPRNWELFEIAPGVHHIRHFANNEMFWGIAFVDGDIWYNTLFPVLDGLQRVNKAITRNVVSAHSFQSFGSHLSPSKTP